MGSIYLITNLVNNKKYIGQTKRQLNIRIQEHLQIAQHTKYNLHLYNSIRRYGVDKFGLSSKCYYCRDFVFADYNQVG